MKAKLDYMTDDEKLRYAMWFALDGIGSNATTLERVVKEYPDTITTERMAYLLDRKGKSLGFEKNANGMWTIP